MTSSSTKFGLEAELTGIGEITKRAAAMNPFVFIVGCARSGTTLLQRIIDAHPLIAVINETRCIPDWFVKRVGVTPDGLATPELASHLLAYPRFAQLGISREQVDQLNQSVETITYAKFITGVFDLYGKVRGKGLVGDKTPRYVRKLPLLHTLWPTAKFVHLIRDGRDACLSIMNWKKSADLAQRFATWREHPVTTVALWWEWHVRLGCETGRALGSDLYRETRYEDLVSQPELECSNLCGFLGVPYEADMLQFHEGRVRHDSNLDAKKAWLPPTPGLRDWRSQMTAEDVERFEAASGDLLDELGYPRAFPHPRPQALEHACRIRELFIRHVRSKGPLPESWHAADLTLMPSE